MGLNEVQGFSKFSKSEKINWIIERFFHQQVDQQIAARKVLESFWHESSTVQSVFDEFSENSITNFYTPYGVAPNFFMNGHSFCVPMVIEESSVVAAAALAAKFWQRRGGFSAQVLATVKYGQVHFTYSGDPLQLRQLFEDHRSQLLDGVFELDRKMRARGGGIQTIELRQEADWPQDYFQLMGHFETCDAMGANYINSLLEQMARQWSELVARELHQSITVIMAILSNYNPQCLVRAQVSCPLSQLDSVDSQLSGREFAQKFKLAVDVAHFDRFRATTHNKGIMNGVDAVVVATGNDYRAIEAACHAYAARDGQYRSLSRVDLLDDSFCFSLELPLSLGTVGGLTALHPMAKFSLELLNHPSARELMQIVASVGLAQNFSALRSLVTTGIQKGHMKMHLLNILRGLQASAEEVREAKKFFKDKVISYAAVENFIQRQRQTFLH